MNVTELFPNPAVNAASGGSPKVELNPPNSFSAGKVEFEALSDRILIEEDPFRSGYECTGCGGSGKAGCGNCVGGTTSTGKKCSHCEDGMVTCSVCSGKGGLLIAPEVSQRRPTTGKVVSVGEDVKTLRVGDSVMYSNFAGYVVDLARAGQSVVLRILHESEVLCKVRGQLELRTLRGKSEVAVFNS
jgi:co-chaperonin GroES (HSP10)